MNTTAEVYREAAIYLDKVGNAGAAQELRVEANRLDKERERLHRIGLALLEAAADGNELRIAERAIELVNEYNAESDTTATEKSN